MAKRRRHYTPHQVSISSRGFNTATLAQMVAIPVLTTVFIGGGFYFALKDLPAKIEQEQKVRETALKEEADNRDRLRNALTDYAGKTQHSVDSLAAHAMVQDEQIKAVGEQVKSVNTNLDRVVNGLQNIEIAVGKVKK